MTTMIDAFKDVVKLWPSARAMAEDLGVNPEAVPGWKRTDSIPAKYWVDILEKKPAKRARLTLRRLAELAALEKK
jgi:hypothetical protein